MLANIVPFVVREVTSRKLIRQIQKTLEEVDLLELVNELPVKELATTQKVITARELAAHQRLYQLHLLVINMSVASQHPDIHLFGQLEVVAKSRRCEEDIVFCVAIPVHIGVPLSKHVQTQSDISVG